MSLTLTEYVAGVRSGKIDGASTIISYLEKAKTQDSYNAFIRLHPEYVQMHMQDFLSKPLAGAPIALKDIFLTKGYETTCASKILVGHIPTYSSTVVEKLEQAGALMIGKTNMDEFAMGASGENSAFGPATNPYDATCVAGGSSSGSAAAVAADLCLAALGTDTGGSIRMPAALCGIVGTKATYGRTSRYGVQAMCSSLDHIGTLTKTVEDAVLLFNTMSDEDPNDMTTIPCTEKERKSWSEALTWKSLAGKKIAVPHQFFDEGLDTEIKTMCLETIDQMKQQGAEVDRIDMPILAYSVPTYYILMPAEASTNMARFDGLRFGLQGDTGKYDRIKDYYAHIRGEGFGDEVKRRILTGAYVLSAGFYDAYYRKALAVRATMQAEFARVFEKYDAIVGPTSPELARPLGGKTDDPVKMYLVDIYTCSANLVGNPAISVPIGTLEKNGKQLPVGFQIMTAHRDEATMFGMGKMVEKRLIVNN